jgi:hypothetical protein
MEVVPIAGRERCGDPRGYLDSGAAAAGWRPDGDPLLVAFGFCGGG